MAQMQTPEVKIINGSTHICSIGNMNNNKIWLD